MEGAIAGPNPFYPATDPVMEFQKLTANAEIKVYSILGKLVGEFADLDGDGQISWDATANNNGAEKLPSGTYICYIKESTGTGNKILKIVIIR